MTKWYQYLFIYDFLRKHYLIDDKIPFFIYCDQIVKNWFNKFSNKFFNLNKNVSNCDWVMVFVTLFKSRSKLFEKSMQISDKCIDVWRYFSVNIICFEDIKPVLEKLYNSHIKPLNIRLIFLSDTNQKRWACKLNLNLFI